MRMCAVSASLWLCFASAAVPQPALPLEATITNAAQPVVTVKFSQPIRSAHISINGVDYTQNANIYGNTLTLHAPIALPNGQHTVTANGINILGIPERGVWHFTLSGNSSPSPATAGALSTTPANGAVVASPRPELSAVFAEQVRSANVIVDGQQQSGLFTISNNSVLLFPRYDLAPGRHTVTVQGVGAQSGTNYVSTWSFDVPDQAQSPALQAQITNQFPPNHGQVADSQPTIGANFPPGSHNWRVLIDGQDLTARAQRVGHRVTWRPDYPLQFGPHTAHAYAVLPTGQVVNSTWTFSVSADPDDELEDAELDLQGPVNGQRVDNVFEVEGTAPPLTRVTVTLRAGRKALTFRGKADRAGYFSIPASTKWAKRSTRINVEVAASGVLVRRQVVKR